MIKIGDVCKLNLPSLEANGDVRYVVIGEPVYSAYPDGTQVVMVSTVVGSGMPVNAKHCEQIDVDYEAAVAMRQAYRDLYPKALKIESADYS